MIHAAMPCRMPHILQYISEHWAPPPEVKTENGHMHQEGDAPLPQTAQLLAAIVTVLLQHGRLRCAAIGPDCMALSGMHRQQAVVSDQRAPYASTQLSL
jgi:hypothetical protein